MFYRLGCGRGLGIESSSVSDGTQCNTIQCDRHPKRSSGSVRVWCSPIFQYYYATDIRNRELDFEEKSGSWSCLETEREGNRYGVGLAFRMTSSNRPFSLHRESFRLCVRWILQRTVVLFWDALMDRWIVRLFVSPSINRWLPMPWRQRKPFAQRNPPRFRFPVAGP